jgi:hypothetical protein
MVELMTGWMEGHNPNPWWSVVGEAENETVEFRNGI